MFINTGALSFMSRTIICIVTVGKNCPLLCPSSAITSNVYVAVVSLSNKLATFKLPLEGFIEISGASVNTSFLNVIGSDSVSDATIYRIRINK